MLNPQRGQVMLVTVLLLFGALLSATTIAGVLTLYQLRQATDVNNSARAIYAADSGIEWRIYKLAQDNFSCVDCPSGSACPQPVLANGATFTVTCSSAVTASPTTDADGSQAITIKSVGESHKNYRALLNTVVRVLPKLPPPPPPAP